MTGRSAHANGLVGLAHDSWLFYDDVRTMPELMRELGYTTTLMGLQHEQPDPLVLGYDRVGGVGFLPRALQIADSACEWLENEVGDQPFLLNVGMWEAHRPWPAEDYDPADPTTVHVPAYLPDNDDTRADIAAMYGSLRQFDEAVGRVLTALDEQPYADNTLVILTTDHGVAFPRAKSTLYDSGTGVSFVVRPPKAWGVAAGRIVEPISQLDLLPTLLELAGGEPLPVHEGHSFADTLREGVEPVEHPIYTGKTYHDCYDPIRAVRTKTRKYIKNFADGPKLPLAKDLEESLTRRGMGDDHLAPRSREEFYLLDVDRDELTNVIDDERHASEVDDMRTMLADWMAATDDPLLKGSVPPATPPVRSTRMRDK